MIKNNKYIILLSLITSLFLTIIFLGTKNILFTNTSWMEQYDTISDFLALKFFLQDNWRFPIGYNPNYGELNNSIVFSGSIPLLSFIFKIFKNFLPYNFHFFSMWIFLSFSLHIFFSYKIINFLTKNNQYAFISSLFFIVTPILIQRLEMHLSLGAHWLILAFIYIEINTSFKKKNFLRILIILISSLIHFYFTIMLIGLNIIFSIGEYFRFLNKKKIIKDNLILLISLIFIMYATGYFIIPASDSLGYGYGVYKANILTFIDPSSGDNYKNWSIFLPDIKNSKGEVEGFGYLGLGIILLFIISLIYVFKNFNYLFKKNIKFIIVAIFFLPIAFSSTVDFGSLTLIDVNLPSIFYAPLSIIRASGRFIWPVYYLIIIFSLIAFYKLKIKIRYLVLILMIQLIDLSGGVYDLYRKNLKPDTNKLLDQFWKNLDANFKKVNSTKYSNTSNIFPIISHLLIDNKYQSTNIARLGRYDRLQASIARSKLYDNLINKDIDLNTIYIVDNFDHLRNLKYIYSDTDHGFFFKDNLWVLLPNKKKLMNTIDFQKFDQFEYQTLFSDKEYFLTLDQEVGVLGFGWSHGGYGRNLNLDGVWTEGYNSTLIFNLQNHEQIKSINFKINNISNKNNEPLLIDITLNNIFLKKIELSSALDFSLEVDNKALVSGENLIHFKIINPITPFSKLESIDSRLLGFKLVSLKLQS